MVSLKAASAASMYTDGGRTVRREKTEKLNNTSHDIWTKLIEHKEVEEIKKDRAKAEKEMLQRTEYVKYLNNQLDSREKAKKDQRKATLREKQRLAEWVGVELSGSSKIASVCWP